MLISPMSDETPYLLKQPHQAYILFQNRLKQSISPVVLVHFDADLLKLEGAGFFGVNGKYSLSWIALSPDRSVSGKPNALSSR